MDKVCAELYALSKEGAIENRIIVMVPYSEKLSERFLKGLESRYDKQIIFIPFEQKVWDEHALEGVSSVLFVIDKENDTIAFPYVYDIKNTKENDRYFGSLKPILGEE